MSDFFDRFLASFPADLQPPEPLLRYFRWADAQGLGRSNGDYHYALIDPSQDASAVVLTPVDPDHARYWMDSEDPAITSRFAPFCRTGGDGSYAALWRDDAGATRIVHMGSGSGSAMVGVLGETPVDFLRLLAIGYGELCWPETHAITPTEAFFEENGEDEEEWYEGAQPPVKPEALQAWLLSEFAVSVPDTAVEVIGALPDMGGEGSDDPFWQWLNRVQGWDAI